MCPPEGVQAEVAWPRSRPEAHRALEFFFATIREWIVIFVGYSSFFISILLLSWLFCEKCFFFMY